MLIVCQKMCCWSSCLDFTSFGPYCFGYAMVFICFDNKEQFQGCNGWTLFLKPLHILVEAIDHIPNSCAKDFGGHQIGWKCNYANFWLCGRWGEF
jgi:hypothetical protein